MQLQFLPQDVSASSRLNVNLKHDTYLCDNIKDSKGSSINVGSWRRGQKLVKSPRTKKVKNSWDFFEGPGTPRPLLLDRILPTRFATNVHH